MKIPAGTALGPYEVLAPIEAGGMSAVYRANRPTTVGMRVGDSQGSVFMRLDLASELVPKVRSRDFFYLTELCFFAERTSATESANTRSFG